MIRRAQYTVDAETYMTASYYNNYRVKDKMLN